VCERTWGACGSSRDPNNSRRGIGCDIGASGWQRGVLSGDAISGEAVDCDGVEQPELEALDGGAKPKLPPKWPPKREEKGSGGRTGGSGGGGIAGGGACKRGGLWLADSAPLSPDETTDRSTGLLR